MSSVPAVMSGEVEAVAADVSEPASLRAALAGADLAWVPIRPLMLATNDLNWAWAIRTGRPVGLVHPGALSAPLHERDERLLGRAPSSFASRVSEHAVDVR